MYKCLALVAILLCISLVSIDRNLKTSVTASAGISKHKGDPDEDSLNDKESFYLEWGNLRSSVLNNDYLENQISYTCAEEVQEDIDYLDALEQEKQLHLNRINLLSEEINSDLLYVEQRQISIKYLQQYANYEHDSQRVEQQDVYYRLNGILSNDYELLKRQYEVDTELRNKNALSTENLESTFLLLTEIILRNKTLGDEHDVLDILAEGSNELQSALKEFSTHLESAGKYLNNKKELLEAEKGLYFVTADRCKIERLLKLITSIFNNSKSSDLHSIILATGRALRSSDELKGVILNDQVKSLEQLREFLVNFHLEIRAAEKNLLSEYLNKCLSLCQLIFESDMQASVAEERYSCAKSKFSEYLREQISVQIKKLNQKSELLEKSAKIATDQGERREKLQKDGASLKIEGDFFASFARHFSEASQRSWADQATLSRLIKALKTFEVAEDSNRKYIESKKLLIESKLQTLRDLKSHSSIQYLLTKVMLEEKVEPFQDLAKRLRTQVSFVIAEEGIYDKELVFKQLLLMNDPSPIQMRGADDILQKAIFPKDRDMVEMRNLILRSWDRLKSRR